MIKKIRFEITSGGYAEMAHLAFFIRNVRLGVNTTNKTLTLRNGTVHTFTCKASSEYGSGYTTLGIFDEKGPDHSGSCWCSAGAGGNHWIELEFTPPLPNSFANKLTFCCGQGHGSYPATFTLFFIDENDTKRQIKEPLSVNSDNGLFEWTSIISCLLGKNGRYYFLKPKKTSNTEEVI